ncbi:FKBP-type peptidyl-prolyl cis-trans isomerase [Clavibacter tessellarius]|uniref:FKBP-type peptidyl-prolyl cis-trans isomerase n=1 Tax=Clavibacter tessellarius TaxID=31965 RepID=UPI003254D6B0
MQYTGINWNTKKVFDSSWDKGGKPVSFQTSGVIPGFTKALVGQKVGSQVIAIIPPADAATATRARATTSAAPTPSCSSSTSSARSPPLRAK